MVLRDFCVGLLALFLSSIALAESHVPDFSQGRGSRSESLNESWELLRRLSYFTQLTSVEVELGRSPNPAGLRKTTDLLFALVPRLQATIRDNKKRRIILTDDFWEAYSGNHIDVSEVDKPDFSEKLFQSIVSQKFDRGSIQALERKVSQRTGVRATCTGYLSRNECGEALLKILNSPYTAYLPWRGVRSLLLGDQMQQSGDPKIWWLNASSRSPLRLEDQLSWVATPQSPLLNQNIGWNPQPQFLYGSQWPYNQNQWSPQSQFNYDTGSQGNLYQSPYYYCPRCGRYHLKYRFRR